MARLSPAQIARAAHQAGFRGNALVEIVAIALAESGGQTHALNTKGEHSVGLTQINMNAHGTRFGSRNQLYDPVTNMRAAFQLSRGGKNFRPWSVHRSSPSPHAGASNRHLAVARRAITQMPDVSDVSAQPRSIPQFQGGSFQDPGAFQAAQDQAAEEMASAAHQERMMQVMGLLLRQQQSRNRPIPARRVRVDETQFDPRPFQQRLQQMEGETSLIPQVIQRQTANKGRPSREAMLQGFNRQSSN